jgi:virulence factor Mce-like protein
MRRILISAALILGCVAFLVIAGGASSSGSSSQGTYKIEFDNAFGLVNGSDFKVAGVPAGTIKSIGLDQKTLHAVVTIQVSQPGLGQFHSDAFCESRPQSLIGEYFVDCQPGSKGKVLPSGSTIPVQNTQSTIPADLLQDIMQMPYRERFTLIINELGAAVASRSEDLQAALERADPAITETDNLLNLLANDAQTIKQLNVNADSVITALANNSSQVQKFIDMANNTATDTATQQTAFQQTWAKLPGFLEQLKPAMNDLDSAVTTNTPVLRNLNTASSQLDRFFTDVVPFSRAALPSLQSLGKASVTGRSAVQAATPLVSNLNQFAKPTPELAQNLAIVGHDLDDRSRAVEPDPRSPGGKGYTGLEALLQYVFNQATAINYFGMFGHELGVDAFVSKDCSPYTTPTSLASNLKSGSAAARSCLAWLGPNQTGINQPDPTDGGVCVQPGLSANSVGSEPTTTVASCKPEPGTDTGSANKKAKDKSTSKTAASTQSRNPAAAPGSSQSGSSSSGSSSGSGGSVTTTITSTVSKIVSALTGGSSSSSGALGTSTSTPNSSNGSAGNQTQQLLNYLLAP